MKNWWNGWHKLSVGQMFIALQVATQMLTYKLGLKVLPFSVFKKIYAATLQWPRFMPEPTTQQIHQRSWLIQGVANRLGFFSLTCLPQALAMQFYLRQLPASRLHIGVRLSDQQIFEAHAWVTYQQQVVIGETPNASFQPIWEWS